MLAMVRPTGRIAIMDAGYPPRAGEADETTALRPIAWLLCRMFAADPRRQPWRPVLTDTARPREERFTFGYIGVAAGIAPSSGRAAEEPPHGTDRPHRPEQPA